MPAMEEDLVQKIGGPASWTGKELVGSKWWGYTLPDSALAELDDAIKFANASGLEWEGDIPLNVTQEKFPLKQMGDIIAEMSDELENGNGAAMLANIPVHKYTLEEVRQRETPRLLTARCDESEFTAPSAPARSDHASR